MSLRGFEPKIENSEPLDPTPDEEFNDPKPEILWEKPDLPD